MVGPGGEGEAGVGADTECQEDVDGSAGSREFIAVDDHDEDEMRFPSSAELQQILAVNEQLSPSAPAVLEPSPLQMQRLTDSLREELALSDNSDIAQRDGDDRDAGDERGGEHWSDEALRLLAARENQRRRDLERIIALAESAGQGFTRFADSTTSDDDRSISLSSESPAENLQASNSEGAEGQRQQHRASDQQRSSAPPSDDMDSQQSQAQARHPSDEIASTATGQTLTGPPMSLLTQPPHRLGHGSGAGDFEDDLNGSDGDEEISSSAEGAGFLVMRSDIVGDGGSSSSGDSAHGDDAQFPSASDAIAQASDAIDRASALSTGVEWPEGLRTPPPPRPVDGTSRGLFSSLSSSADLTEEDPGPVLGSPRMESEPRPASASLSADGVLVYPSQSDESRLARNSQGSLVYATAYPTATSRQSIIANQNAIQGGRDGPSGQGETRATVSPATNGEDPFELMTRFQSELPDHPSDEIDNGQILQAEDDEGGVSDDTHITMSAPPGVLRRPVQESDYDSGENAERARRASGSSLEEDAIVNSARTGPVEAEWERTDTHPLEPHLEVLATVPSSPHAPPPARESLDQTEASGSDEGSLNSAPQPTPDRTMHSPVQRQVIGGGGGAVGGGGGPTNPDDTSAVTPFRTWIENPAFGRTSDEMQQRQEQVQNRERAFSAGDASDAEASGNEEDALVARHSEPLSSRSLADGAAAIPLDESFRSRGRWGRPAAPSLRGSQRAAPHRIDLADVDEGANIEMIQRGDRRPFETEEAKVPEDGGRALQHFPSLADRTPDLRGERRRASGDFRPPSEEGSDPPSISRPSDDMSRPSSDVDITNGVEETKTEQRRGFPKWSQRNPQGPQVLWAQQQIRRQRVQSIGGLSGTLDHSGDLNGSDDEHSSQFSEDDDEQQFEERRLDQLLASGRRGPVSSASPSPVTPTASSAIDTARGLPTSASKTSGSRIFARATGFRMRAGRLSARDKSTRDAHAKVAKAIGKAAPKSSLSFFERFACGLAARSKPRAVDAPIAPPHVTDDQKQYVAGLLNRVAGLTCRERVGYDTTKCAVCQGSGHYYKPTFEVLGRQLFKRKTCRQCWGNGRIRVLQAPEKKHLETLHLHKQIDFLAADQEIGVWIESKLKWKKKTMEQFFAASDVYFGPSGQRTQPSSVFREGTQFGIDFRLTKKMRKRMFYKSDDNVQRYNVVLFDGSKIQVTEAQLRDRTKMNIPEKYMIDLEKQNGKLYYTVQDSGIRSIPTAGTIGMYFKYSDGTPDTRGAIGTTGAVHGYHSPIFTEIIERVTRSEYDRRALLGAKLTSGADIPANTIDRGEFSKWRRFDVLLETGESINIGGDMLKERPECAVAASIDLVTDAPCLATYDFHGHVCEPRADGRELDPWCKKCWERQAIMNVEQAPLSRQACTRCGGMISDTILEKFVPAEVMSKYHRSRAEKARNGRSQYTECSANELQPDVDFVKFSIPANWPALTGSKREYWAKILITPSESLRDPSPIPPKKASYLHAQARRDRGLEKGVEEEKKQDEDLLASVAERIRADIRSRPTSVQQKFRRLAQPPSILRGGRGQNTKRLGGGTLAPSTSSGSASSSGSGSSTPSEDVFMATIGQEQTEEFLQAEADKFAEVDFRHPYERNRKGWVQIQWLRGQTPPWFDKRLYIGKKVYARNIEFSGEGSNKFAFGVITKLDPDNQVASVARRDSHV